MRRASHSFHAVSTLCERELVDFRHAVRKAAKRAKYAIAAAGASTGHRLPRATTGAPSIVNTKWKRRAASGYRMSPSSRSLQIPSR